jgi:hypothetical protein
MKKVEKEDQNLLDAEFLVDNGFTLNEERPFENYDLPYYVKDSVLLFFNVPVTKWNQNSFLIGYGEMRMGKYYAVTFRWIINQKELIDIYEVLTGKIWM